MNWNNQNKDATTFTNQQHGSQDLTWNEANFTWDAAQGTWGDPFSWANQNKDATTFQNETKH